MDMVWQILITDGLDPAGVEVLQRRSEVILEESLDLMGEVDALIVRSKTKVTAEILARGAPRLKVVGRAGVGVDNIDLDAARRSGVAVVNAPHGATIAVAEHTLALMLALARHILRADAGMRQGKWEKKQIKGTELNGKTLGVIGTGRIGAAVAKRAAGMGMHVVGYDAYLAQEEVEALGIEPCEMDALLARSDYISLHLPLSDETRGMIDAETLKRVKPGARLISTSRGGVVEEQDLLAALEEGQLEGAALDVFAQEPPGLTPLVAHPKVITTPHVGAQTVEAQRRAALDIADEVLAVLAGEPPRWRVA